jgi:hypothetical protein
MVEGCDLHEIRPGGSHQMDEHRDMPKVPKEEKTAPDNK